MHAMASDPDGDEVSCGWFRYADADGYAGEVTLEMDGSVCMVRVPDDARPGDTVHVICRVTDEGGGRDEYMVSYARVIITVAALEGLQIEEAR